MTQRRLRITAAALALAAALGLAGPAHAAGPAVRTPGLSWIEDVVQWVARIWMGNGQQRAAKYGGAIDPNGGQKSGPGIDPNGGPAPTPPSGAGTNGATAPAPDPSDYGAGIDPNG